MMDDLLDRVDEFGNSFFLRLENMNRNEQILFFLGCSTALLAYGKMKSGAMHSSWYTLFGVCAPQTEVRGYFFDT
jgi:hypothetical protein